MSYRLSKSLAVFDKNKRLPFASRSWTNSILSFGIVTPSLILSTSVGVNLVTLPVVFLVSLKTSTHILSSLSSSDGKYVTPLLLYVEVGCFGYRVNSPPILLLENRISVIVSKSLLPKLKTKLFLLTVS